MSFADYTDLRIAVAEQVGNRDISDVMDRFTKSAEAWFNREIRTRQQLKTATLVFVGGVAALPSDFIEVSVLMDVNKLPVSVAVRGAVMTESNGYRVIGDSVSWPQVVGNRELEYYAKLPSLTDALTPSNWLLVLSPNLYLYAVTLEAAKWLKDVDTSTAMAGLIKDEVQSLIWSDVRARYGSSIITTAGYGP
jgi:hypothetical protein